MSAPLRVADIASYLTDSGWLRQPDAWRGASIWSHGDERQVLLPARDDMGDGELRVRQILDVLTDVEQRPRDEIARDIDSPLVDIQSYRTFPDDLPSGLTPLGAALRALRGVHDLFVSAARAVVEGPHLAFPGQPGDDVTDLVDRTQLAPTRPGSYVFVVRVPADDPLGRLVSHQLHDAVTALARATATGEPAAVDDTVTAGVSAQLCVALRELTGDDGGWPFEIGFRWGRGVPSVLPPAAVRFERGAGLAVAAAGDRLRELDPSGDATVVGLVESLHDEPARDDRWRIRVRGEIATPHGRDNRRTVWVRLADSATYDRAIAAHRSGARVRVRGALSTTPGRRAELRAAPTGFEVLG